MKVSQYETIGLDQIDSNDLFYIVDSSETDAKLSSKNMTYATLLSALNRDLEQVQIVKEATYDKDKKILKIYIELTDGTTKLISVDMDVLNIYSVTDGLSNYNGNDNVFSIDWTKVYKKSELSSASEVNVAIEAINSKSWLTANALDALSTRWEDAYNKTINAKHLISTDLTDIVDNVTISVVDDKLSCIKSGGSGGKDYYAGNGLSLDTNTNTFSVSADYTTFKYVTDNLSNTLGHTFCFRDYPQT